MSEACEALGIPVVGGNVSFYNESRGRDIDPTPVVGVVGLIDELDAVPPAPALHDGDAHRACSVTPRPSSAARSGPRCTACATARRPRPTSTSRPRCTISSRGLVARARGRRRARLLRRRARGRARRDGDRRGVRLRRSRSAASSLPALAWFSESASRVVRRRRPRPRRRRAGRARPAAGVPATDLGHRRRRPPRRRRRLRRRARRRHRRLARRPPSQPSVVPRPLGTIDGDSTPRIARSSSRCVRDWSGERTPGSGTPAACSASTRPVRPWPHLTYLGLYALQHRGQESAGIAVSDGQTITVVKDMGLVTQVFDERRLAPLDGHLAIGHVRYSTTGSSTLAQRPARLPLGRRRRLRARPQRQPHQHRASSPSSSGCSRACCPADSRPRLHHRLRARRRAHRRTSTPTSPAPTAATSSSALERVLPQLEGGFSFVMMDDAHLIGVRDPHGFWPLVLGRIESGWVLASETRRARHRRRALRARGRAGRDGRDRRVGRARAAAFAEPDPKLCLFEFVYFARPDTNLYGHERARGAPAHGRGARAPGAGRRRHGDAGPRVGHPRRAGLRARVGHPLRRRPGEEPLRRPHVHPAQPEAARRRACGSSSTRCPRTSGASGSWSSTTRSCAAPPPRQVVSDAARGGRGRGALPGVVAAVQVAVLLRHGHRPPLRAARRRPVGRRDPRLPRRRLARLPRARPPASPPPARRRDSFCTACLSGDYPVPGAADDRLEARCSRRRSLDARRDRRAPPRDRGRRPRAEPRREPLTYADAGVDIAAGEKAVELIKEHVRSTFRPEVVGDIGGFGGLFALEPLPLRATRCSCRRPTASARSR